MLASIFLLLYILSSRLLNRFFFLSLYSFVSKTFHLVTQQTCRLTNVLGIQDGMKEVLSLKRPVTALARFMSTQHKLKSSEKRNLG